MAPIAQTKTNDIIEELVKINSRKPANKFALNGFKKDAGAVLKNDPVVGYTTLGAISCLEHDFEAMHKFHELALSCSSRSFYAMTNYAVSLSKSFLWEGCLSICLENYQNDPSNLNATAALINALFNVGKFSDAAVMLKTWNKLVPDQPYGQEVEISSVLAAVKMLPVNETEIAGIIRLVTGVLASTDLMINEFRIVPEGEETHRFLNIDFEFFEATTDLYQIELQVDELLEKEFDSRVRENIIVTFCYHSVDSAYNSYEFADEGPMTTTNNIVNFKRIEELIKNVEPL